MTDPIVSWAMTKESIEELWVRKIAECEADPKLADLGLVVLLSGWNVSKPEWQERVAAKWREVQSRWWRELREMSSCQIDLKMLRLGDDQSLNELSRLGTRLFVAL